MSTETNPQPLTAGEIDALRRAVRLRSEAEWTLAVDGIKAARGGEYPPDWYERVMASRHAFQNRGGAA